MSDLVPSGDDPDAGLNYDVGVSAHEWRTRWAEVEEMLPDAPGDAIEAATELLADMMRELGVPTDGAAAPETEDMVRELEALRELVDRMRGDEPVVADELEDGMRTAREVYAYLDGGRREDPPGPE